MTSSKGPQRITRRGAITGTLAGLAAEPLMAGARSAGRVAAPPATWDPRHLGERCWLDWRAEDLPLGPVPSWKDRIGGIIATQPDPARCPTRLPSNEVVFEGAGRQLVMPFQPRAHLAHRAVVMVFRIDLSMLRTGEGSLFYCNGIDGGIYARQPAIGYQKTPSGASIWICWRDTRDWNKISFPITDDRNRWHCLVSRRVQGKHYASLDGGAEQTVGENICLGKNNVEATGLIGDFRSTAPTWALDSLVLLQDELSASDAQRLAAWGLYRRGAQAALPDTHAFKSTPPAAERSDTAPPPPESSTGDWSVLQQAWSAKGPGRLLNPDARKTLDLSGYLMVFEDHFETMSVTDELTGRGPWWSPVHQAATGSARTAKLATDPGIFTQSGSELTIRMQKTNKGWTSGVFTSVNANGHGNTWKYGYFEFRARASKGNGFAAWPALWLKSVNEFFRLTETRVEIDLYEGYNSDPIGHHQSYHNWPAYRLQRGRLEQHRYIGNYSKLVRERYGRDIDLFDDAYHLYGLMIDEQWMRFYFDGMEIGRLPTPPEAKQHLFILVDLAQLPKEAAKASGTYELTLDYVRVYQQPQPA